MTITETCLKATGEIWESYHKKPFVLGIADGSLEKEKFKYYMIQDYLYLIDYTKVFAIGAAKAKDLTVMSLFAGYTDAILNKEMDIHRTYMSRLGISKDQVKETKLSLDNRSYTSYMLRVAYEDGAAEVMAAVLSCALSYEKIAKGMLLEHPKAKEHPFYGEWVSGYAADSYHEENQALIRLMDALGEKKSEKEQVHLVDIFTACSRYESAFWDMAWEMRP